MNEIRLRLIEASLQRRYVWIATHEAIVKGIVLSVSDRLSLIYRFVEFTHAGYVVIQHASILELDFGNDALSFFEHMLRGEGLLQDIAPPYPLLLSSMSVAITAMKEHDEFLLVHRGPREHDNQELCVGRIESIDDLRLKMRCVNAAGEWTGHITMSPLEIARVEFHSPYLILLKKYTLNR